MPDPAAPDAAVQIVIRAIHMRCDGPLNARNVLAALDRHGWLHDPAELDATRARVAALEAVAEAARRYRAAPTDSDVPDNAGDWYGRLCAALDAVTAADTTSGGEAS